MNPKRRGKTGGTLLHHLTDLANFKDDVGMVKYLLGDGGAQDPNQAWYKCGLAFGIFRLEKKMVLH